MTMAGIDHGFCINLDRRPDRLAAFRARLPGPMLGMIERFPAIDGRALSMNAEIETLFARNDFHYRRNIIGCSLSHLALWRRIASDDYPYERTAIFEDDAWFSQRFLGLWNDEMAPRLPADFDLVYLGGLLGPPTIQGMTELMAAHNGHVEVSPDVYMATRENDYFVRPRETQFCTYSYLLSRAGARALCALVERDGFERSIDWFMIDRWGEMAVYATTPLLCWAVFQEGSDILLDFDVLGGARETTSHA